MADQITTDEDGKTYRNGMLQIRSGSPGIHGAISDMISAIAQHLHPSRELMNRGKQINQTVEEAAGNGSTDLGQQF
jgi:hypothetical protein